MRRLILLDIDGVLLPWEGLPILRSGDPFDPDGQVTGFTDWERVHAPYFSFISRTQQEMIRQAGDVFWLTTWAAHGMEGFFTEKTGFGPFNVACPPNRERMTYASGWWKAFWVIEWAEENPRLIQRYDEVLWVDDDHYLYKNDASAAALRIRDMTGVPVLTHNPYPVWTRTNLELLDKHEP